MDAIIEKTTIKYDKNGRHNDVFPLSLLLLSFDSSRILSVNTVCL